MLLGACNSQLASGNVYQSGDTPHSESCETKWRIIQDECRNYFSFAAVPKYPFAYHSALTDARAVAAINWEIVVTGSRPTLVRKGCHFDGPFPTRGICCNPPTVVRLMMWIAIPQISLGLATPLFFLRYGGIIAFSPARRNRPRSAVFYKYASNVCGKLVLDGVVMVETRV